MATKVGIIKNRTQEPKSSPLKPNRIAHFYCFPDGTSVKELACQCRRHKRRGFHPWVGKVPRRRAWQPTPVFLPGGSQGQRSLEGCSPRGRKESDTTEATQRARGRVDRWMDGRSGGGKLRPQRCQLVWRLPRPRCDRRGQGVGQLGE